MNSKVEIYKSEDNQTNVVVQFDGDAVWLNQKQIQELFNSSKSNISEHIKSIYESRELEEKSTVRKFRTVQKEGKREVVRTISHYNLDLIISLGYRVNSHEGIQFRQWATSKLKELLVEGFTLNKKRLEQKEQEVIHLRNGIKILSRVIEEKSDLEDNQWLENYAIGLKLLDDYDHEALDVKGVSLTAAEYPKPEQYSAIVELMRDEFNSEVFGKEKDGGFKSATEQIKKGFNDTDFYTSIEEKAANLLYLIVKNHAFVDGNKRIAAACFLLFLEQNNLLNNSLGKLLVSNEALASLTLFVASSKAEEKNSVVKLIVSVLNRNQT